MNKKNILLIFIVVLISNNFAAIVSDNDGAAFTTKAEFDALKRSFNSQIDNYNLSLDNKINGAIASYLSGLRISTEDTLSVKIREYLDSDDLHGIPNYGDTKIQNMFKVFTTSNYAKATLGCKAQNDTAVNFNNIGSSHNEWYAEFEEIKRDGKGFALWAKESNSKKVTSINSQCYLIVFDNTFARKSYQVWGTTNFFDKENENLNLKTFYGVDTWTPMGDSNRNNENTIFNAYRDWCLGNTFTKPTLIVQAGSYGEGKWYNSSSSYSSRFNVLYGNVYVDEHLGNVNNCFISSSSKGVLIRNETNKQWSKYWDTELDSSEIVKLTDPVFILGSASQHTSYPGSYAVIIPIIDWKIFEYTSAADREESDNYIKLSQVYNGELDEILDEVSDLKFSDGLPIIKLKKAGIGKIKLKIANTDEISSSTYEVFLSKKPFSTKTTSDLYKISINGVENAKDVPVNTEVEIKFEGEKDNNVFLWWQAKGYTYGGLLTKLSDIDFVSKG